MCWLQPKCPSLPTYFPLCVLLPPRLFRCRPGVQCWRGPDPCGPWAGLRPCFFSLLNECELGREQASFWIVPVIWIETNISNITKYHHPLLKALQQLRVALGLNPVSFMGWRRCVSLPLPLSTLHSFPFPFTPDSEPRGLAGSSPKTLCFLWLLSV